MISSNPRKLTAIKHVNEYILNDTNIAFVGAVGDYSIGLTCAQLPPRYDFQYLIKDIQIKWPTSFNVDYTLNVAFWGLEVGIGNPVLSGNGGKPLSSVNYDSIAPDNGNGNEESPLNGANGGAGFNLEFITSTQLKTQQTWVSLGLPEIMLYPILDVEGIAPALNYYRRSITIYSDIDLVTALGEDCSMRVIYEHIKQ